MGSDTKKAHNEHTMASRQPQAAAEPAGSATGSAPVEASGGVDPRVARIYQRLVETYGEPRWEPDGDALGGLIATVLSQHTSDVNSARAYATLIERFPTWEAVRDAPTNEIADAIRVGGLAQIKAERIQRILRELTERLRAEQAARGVQDKADEADEADEACEPRLTLDVLRGLPLAQAQEYLLGFSGVGPKTAACVLLFSLGKPAFPVDTHVWRVTKRLGLIGQRVSADAAHTILLGLIPPEWRHTMHVDLIQHGRRICHAQRPVCQRCPLRADCQYYWTTLAQASR